MIQMHKFHYKSRAQQKLLRWVLEENSLSLSSLFFMSVIATLIEINRFIFPRNPVFFNQSMSYPKSKNGIIFL